MNPPRTAYISLWFPKPSETFIFREVKKMRDMGLPLQVFTLYAGLTKNLSPEMQAFPPSESLGSIKTPMLFGTLIKHLVSAPVQTFSMLKAGPFNKWRSLEGLGENLWAFCCGLHLVRRFREEGIQHIHAPWAGGPATAAWVASRLTGIPFSFAGRAGDIYPPEGSLCGKIKDASFVRVNHGANVSYLQSVAEGHEDKITLVYNALSLAPEGERLPSDNGKLRLLAAGRLVRTKGFDNLLDACSIVKEQGVDFLLTFAGDGMLRSKLTRQAVDLGLTDFVDFKGFLSHDALSRLMLASDALVMPSVVDTNGDRDGIPNVIMEAYAHGLPVIATDVAGISEVVINDRTGYLVPQRSPEILADAIIRLARAPEGAQSLADAGKSHVMDLFDQEKNCSTLIELFSAHARGAD
ncbi:glycosyltransferase family 4 protein [Pseudodesulfovibrio methanolicus]|uniref:Glycosyltransferase family 4 protein n=1 Tax=Pseudodesulfovibrio methanolicus TaxID=3126690 RepID=A0ABZ2ITU8_9BACT